MKQIDISALHKTVLCRRLPLCIDVHILLYAVLWRSDFFLDLQFLDRCHPAAVYKLVYYVLSLHHQNEYGPCPISVCLGSWRSLTKAKYRYKAFKGPLLALKQNHQAELCSKITQNCVRQLIGRHRHCNIKGRTNHMGPGAGAKEPETAEGLRQHVLLDLVWS